MSLGTVLANGYETAGTSQAVTVPYQAKPFLGFIFIQAASFSGISPLVVPGWGFPSASSGAGGAAAVYVKAFDDPPNPFDPDLTPTVNVDIGPLLVIALSVSRDGPDVYNIGYHDTQTGTGWSGALVPATGTVKETPSPISWDSDDIETLAFVTSFLSNVTPGTVTVTPAPPLVDVAEVDASTVAWAIEVCRDPANDGTDKTLTVDGTSSGGTRRIDGAVFTFHISSTLVRPDVSYFFDRVGTSGPAAIVPPVGECSYITVPAGHTSMTVDLRGAQGGNELGGKGGRGDRIVASVPVTPGEILQVCVGTHPTNMVGGFNGGGRGGGSSGATGGGGGGATDIRRAPYGLADRLAVAAGGGGAGSYGGPGSTTGNEGGYGGTEGDDGWTSGLQPPTVTTPGRGATPSAGGTAGTGGTGSNAATDGTLGQGGDAAFQFAAGGVFSGGGGGGLYGGGGGGHTFASRGAGGGGGSSGAPGGTIIVEEQGVNAGDGSASITF